MNRRIQIPIIVKTTPIKKHLSKTTFFELSLKISVSILSGLIKTNEAASIIKENTASIIIPMRLLNP
ncbi:hypothetical protein FACS189483_04650 [Spirochaetia bacterium]|nr:hypothetical protein FACS189483_04650 [Spirochaetia bacterium]